MDLDARLRRFFPLIVCLLIALVAYLQAQGVGAMLGAVLAPTVAATARPAMLPVGRAARPSGKSILARNPFDSTTGPLDGQPLGLPEPPQGPGPNGEPGADVQQCSFGRVLLIAASEDPEWSFAAIEGGAGGSKLRRVGDVVEGYTLETLAWDRVWLTDGTKRCQMSVGDKSRARKPAGRAKARRKPSRRRRRHSNKLPPELAAKIHRVSDTEVNIERSVVDAVLEQQAQLMRNTRLRPMREGDKVVGLRLARVGPGTLFDALGLRNGDQLRSVNGFDLTNPQKALEAYGRLRTADRLSLQIMRNGAPTSIDFNIQ